MNKRSAPGPAPLPAAREPANPRDRGGRTARFRSMGLRGLGAGIALAAVPSLAFAQELDSGDTAWMMTATALVLFMTAPGLSLFYAGMVRSKNVLSVFMQCFAIAGLVSLLWFTYAYSLAFGEGGAVIGDFSRAFLNGVTVDAMSGTIPESVFMTYHLAFAIITPALIVGAFAERMKFSAMLVFIAFWLTLCYAPVCHWVWGGGWLDRIGILDFSGGTVVHVNAGVAGLVAAVVIGPRRGYPAVPMPPNNLAYTIVGASMLWVGWFGFNAGSAQAANGTAGNGHGRDPAGGGSRRAGMDVLRMDSPRQGDRAGDRVRCDRRARGDYAGRRFGRTHECDSDGYGLRHRLLLHRDGPETCDRLRRLAGRVWHSLRGRGRRRPVDWRVLRGLVWGHRLR